MKSTSFRVYPIGTVTKEPGHTWLNIAPEFRDGLLGLDGFSHIQVLYWFHQNDSPEGRNTLQVRPRKNPKNPITGVFATHSPRRPNLIALTRCRILSIEKTGIEIDDIDAVDGSPVLDIKCYIPDTTAMTNVRIPEWVGND